MEQVNAVLGLVMSLAKALIAAGLPVLVGNAGGLLLHHLAPGEFFAIPIFTTLARIAGLMTGILVLYSGFDASHYALDELFLPSSHWNLSFGEFLMAHANPLNFGLAEVVGHALHPGETLWPTVLLAAVAVAMATMTGLALTIWPRPLAWRSIATCLGIIALTIWSMVYLVSLALWALHVLNFWVFALLGFYYHYRTSRH